MLWNLGAIRAAVMPIRAYLDGHRFDGETVRLMGIAFEMAVGSLGATPGYNDPLRHPWLKTLLRLRKTVSAIPSVSLRPP